MKRFISNELFCAKIISAYGRGKTKVEALENLELAIGKIQNLTVYYKYTPDGYISAKVRL
jgi:hypothetical protein